MSKYGHTLLSKVAGAQGDIKLKSGPDKNATRVWLSPYLIHQVSVIASGESMPDGFICFKLAMARSMRGEDF